MLSDSVGTDSRAPGELEPTASRPWSSRARRRLNKPTASATIAPHRPFLALLLFGTGIRIAFLLAYRPALLFPDSIGYLTAAYSRSWIGLPALHPVGYSLLIRLLTWPGHSMLRLVVIQHLAGLATGTLVYLALIRARVNRWAATAAAALIIFDGYGMTLEQYLMSDTFFTLALTITLLLACRAETGPRNRSPLPLAALTGLSLAVTTLIREQGLLMVLPLVVYMIWTRTTIRVIALFLACVAIPLGTYATLIDHKYHMFGLTAASGWTFYGRTAAFANCDHIKLPTTEQKLCETKTERASHPSSPDWYIWGPSLAVKAFHPETSSRSQNAVADRTLERFAKTMILHHPLAMLRATAADFLRYFTPGATAYADGVSATSLPSSAAEQRAAVRTARSHVPHLKVSIHSPAKALRTYRSTIHAPRPILALLALAAILAIALRTAPRREIFLFAGSALLLLLETAATGGFSLRYLLPAIPGLAIGGTLALAALGERLRSQTAQASRAASGSRRHRQ